MTELLGRRVLFVHAHPDDETIATGGTIARLLEAGTEVSVVTATRGECGDTVPGSAPDDVTPEQLVQIRLREIDTALAELGAPQHFWLGTGPARAAGLPDREYSDSGMRWDDESGWAIPALDVPESGFSIADPAEPVADLLALIRGLEVELVVSYDDRGGYGHPDHITAHRVARQAAALAGVTFAEVLGAHSAAADGQPADVVRVDVSAQRPKVVAALSKYRTQLESVADDHLVHVGGQRQDLPTVEVYRIH